MSTTHDIDDEEFMQRALFLAKKGMGFVSPNPMVGCVMVKKGKVIAEGYHKKFGGAHAEADALKKFQIPNSKFQILRDATAYVNLEPCSHFGKTPPCADALIAAKVKRVVVGMKDPNSLVAGKGIKKLRAAGIRVDVGVLEKECQELNEDFVKWVATKRPFVVLKVAVTLDGALTLKKGSRSALSSPESYKLVHDLRQRYDAIGLGVKSVIIDNPLLTTRRKQKSRNPVRVIFDTHGWIPKDARLLKQPGRTVVFTSKKLNPPLLGEGEGGVVGKRMSLLLPRTPSLPPPKRGRIESSIEFVQIPKSKDGHVSLPPALKWLGEHGIMSIMIEGGAKLAQSFLQQKLVDKIMITFTPHLSQDPQAPRLFSSFSKFPLQNIRWEQRGPDGWMIAYTRTRPA